ncbi:MAG TPA: hypothetical protein VMI13_01030 [Solirubrobacteraceae bacterium]|nr:hypothetical protein [Solirubrobacteraceae bacterium]
MGPIEEKLQEQFNAGLRGLPWVIRLVAGELEDLSDISAPEFQNGLIALMGVVHKNTLTLAREIDASR